LEFIWYLGFVISNLNTSIGEEDARIPFSQGLLPAAHFLYARLADAPGGTLHEGVSGTPEEIFFPGDVQKS
jgi:hypothetical protein